MFYRGTRRPPSTVAPRTALTENRVGNRNAPNYIFQRSYPTVIRYRVAIKNVDTHQDVPFVRPCLFRLFEWIPFHKGGVIITFKDILNYFTSLTAVLSQDFHVFM